MRSKYVGKELTVVKGGKEYKGVCTSTRTVSGGDQVFLQIPEQGGRYFFVGDLKIQPSKKRPSVTSSIKSAVVLGDGHAGAKKGSNVGRA